MSSESYGYAMTLSMLAVMAMCSLTVSHGLATDVGWLGLFWAVITIVGFTMMLKLIMMGLVRGRKREMAGEWDGR